VLCRSALRREKERAMISRAEERFLADGISLRKRIKTDKTMPAETLGELYITLFKADKGVRTV
jgi:hypothetical protein